MGVKKISYLILKEIHGICETKDPTKNSKLMNIKWQKEKFVKTNLSEKEQNTKNDKNPYVRNDLITTVIKRCRGEKKSNWWI